MLPNFLRYFRGEKKQQGSWLDGGLLSLSDRDVVSHRDAMNHSVILGSPGSGKTSFVLWLMVRQYLRHRYGMVLFCAKPSDKTMYLQWIKAEGREAEVVILEPGGKESLNIFAWQQEASSQGVATNLVALFTIALEMIERQKASHGSDAYWQRAALEFIYYACSLANLAGEQISPLLIYLMLKAAPESLLEEARKHAVSPAEQLDYRLAKDYFTKTFAGLEEKTRSIVTAIVSALLNPFIQSPLRELICDESTFTLEEIYQQRKILIVNLSPSEYFELGRIGTAVTKYVLERAILARNVAVDNQPFAMILDEMHQSVTSYDPTFLALCRSQLCSVVGVIQNLPLLYSALGGDQKANQEGESLLGLFSTKYFAQNSCPVTNAWASGLFGKRLECFASGGTQYGPVDTTSLLGFNRINYTASFSESYSEVLQSNRFASLLTPGQCAEAVIFASGKVFKASGQPYLICSFRRDVP